MKTPSQKVQNIGLALGLAFILVMLTLTGLVWINEPVQAAPPAAPTPVVTGYSNDNINPPSKFWADGTTITADGASTAYLLAQAEALDVQVDLSMPTSNTTTITMQFSNDGTHWVDGLAVGSALVTDTATLQQYANFGYYTRLYIDVATTDTITLNHVSAVARR